MAGDYRDSQIQYLSDRCDRLEARNAELSVELARRAPPSDAGTHELESNRSPIPDETQAEGERERLAKQLEETAESIRMGIAEHEYSALHRAAAALRSAPPGAQGWMPMDTAPKDGRRILAWIRWESPYEHPPSAEFPAVLRWTDHNGGGWVGYHLGTPLLWQPIVAPGEPEQPREELECLFCHVRFYGPPEKWEACPSCSGSFSFARPQPVPEQSASLSQRGIEIAGTVVGVDCAKHVIEVHVPEALPGKFWRRGEAPIGSSAVLLLPSTGETP